MKSLEQYLENRAYLDMIDLKDWNEIVGLVYILLLTAVKDDTRYFVLSHSGVVRKNASRATIGQRSFIHPEMPEEHLKRNWFDKYKNAFEMILKKDKLISKHLRKTSEHADVIEYELL